MSRIVALAVGWQLLVVGPAIGAPCTPDAQRVMDAALVAVLAGETARTAAELRRAADVHRDCPMLAVAASSLVGWDAAAEAARVGGTPDALAPVTRALTALEGTEPRGATPEAYAAALLHGAAAAAQDERDEMRVWMEHARLLDARMALTGERPTWPLPIGVAEGLLWLEVDDFEQAEKAFTAALAENETALGVAGLARARDRRGNKRGACDAFRKVATLVPEAFRSSVVATEARGYVLLCEP